MEHLLINGNEILYHNNGQELCTFRTIIRAGSVDEHDRADYGCAHFLEHMFFKGTETKTWQRITEIGSRLGDQNAYTDNERTCYHLGIVRDDFEEAGDLICDMMFHPKFEKKEFDREKGVIIEECQTYLDDPMWYFFETMQWRYWGDRGHRVVGLKKVLQEMVPERISSFRDRHYKQNRMAFAVVGNLSRERVVDFFEKMEPSDGFFQESETYDRSEPFSDAGDFCFHHQAEQATIGLMGVRVPTECAESHERWKQRVFQNGFGGGMHSMLFHRIREELGYCYHVRAARDVYRDTSAGIVYCMLDKKNVDSARDEIRMVIDKVRTEGFSDDLLETAQKNAYFNVVDARKTSSGFARSVFDKYDTTGVLETLEEVKEAVFSVTNDDVKAAAEFFYPAAEETSFFKMTNEVEYKAEEYV